MEDEMPCPVCKMAVLSDANALKYCKICGMNIKYSSIIVNRHHRKFYFCNESCKLIFLKIGFRGFHTNS